MADTLVLMDHDGGVDDYLSTALLLTMEHLHVLGIVVTPAFHHWHHSAEPQSIDKNFAVHTPVWDLLFGTYYLPGRWPEAYGLAHQRDVPARWTSQFVYPFRKGPTT